MTRIQLTDNKVSIATKMSGGNPGALDVLMQIMTEASLIDPNAWSELAPILSLDSLGVYESDIWLLYKDVCHEDLTNMLCVIRAEQLGFIRPGKLHSAIRSECKLDLDGLLEKVQERLPDFGKTTVVKSEEGAGVDE